MGLAGAFLVLELAAARRTVTTAWALVMASGMAGSGFENGRCYSRPPRGPRRATPSLTTARGKLPAVRRSGRPRPGVRRPGVWPFAHAASVGGDPVGGDTARRRPPPC